MPAWRANQLGRVPLAALQRRIARCPPTAAPCWRPWLAVAPPPGRWLLRSGWQRLALPPWRRWCRQPLHASGACTAAGSCVWDLGSLYVMLLWAGAQLGSVSVLPPLHQSCLTCHACPACLCVAAEWPTWLLSWMGCAWPTPPSLTPPATQVSGSRSWQAGMLCSHSRPHAHTEQQHTQKMCVWLICGTHFGSNSSLQTGPCPCPLSTWMPRSSLLSACACRGATLLAPCSSRPASGLKVSWRRACGGRLAAWLWRRVPVAGLAPSCGAPAKSSAGA